MNNTGRRHPARRRAATVNGKPPFEAVVAAHGATVLRVARAILGPLDADDAWSETFLAAMTTYPGLPADANVEAWLVTIAHHCATNPIPVIVPCHRVVRLDGGLGRYRGGSDAKRALLDLEGAA